MPYLALPGNAGGITAYGLGNPKIDQLELALHHQEVGGLQIRVYNPGLMDCLNGLQPPWHKLFYLSSSLVIMIRGMSECVRGFSVRCD